MHFVAPEELRAIDARGLDELLGRRELTVAMGEGEVRGLAAAMRRASDPAVLDGLQAGAREARERLRWERTVADYAKLIESVS